VAEMISDKNIASFTVASNVIKVAISVLGFLDHVSEIDRKTLKTFGSNAGIGAITVGTTHLGSETNWTIIDVTGSM
jgi:hypothetical protein